MFNKINFKEKDKIWQILEYASGIIAVFSLFIFINLNMSVELRDPDIWLHLKTGEYIIQHQEVPRQDIFSSTVSGKEWINHSWLAQVAFYLVFHFGGPDNLILFSTILVTLAFLFLFLSAGGRQSFIYNIAILFLIIYSSRIRFNIRPENFSILFFSIYLFILSRHIRDKRIFILPLIQLAWVNFHGFFLLGPFLLGIFILSEQLKRTNKLPWEWSKIELLDKQSYRNLVNVFILVCLACFLNPYGYKGALYPIWVSLSSIGKENIFYSYIQELLPTWKLSNKSILPYYILICVSLSVFLSNFKRLNLTHLIIWLAFLGISLPINRNIIFFNFIVYLTVIATLVNRQLNNKIERFLGKTRHIIKQALVILIIFWCILNARSFLKQKYYVFEESRFKGKLLGISAMNFPDKATDFLLENDLPENIFNLFNYGSYFIYRAYPKKKNFIDGRTELYGSDFFKNYQKILHLDKNAINDTFLNYNINTVLLGGTNKEVMNLSTYFFKDPNWAVVYFDGYSVIFLKNTPENRIYIDKLNIDFRNWKVKKADLEEIGITKVRPYPYIERAWMFYYWGLYNQAIDELKEALRILPGSADIYNILGCIYTKQKQYELAYENLRLARIFGPSDYETLKSLGDFYMAKEQFEDALLAYKKLIKLTPDSGEAYALMARAYKKLDNLELAIKSFRSAVSLSPFQTEYADELEELLSETRPSP